MLQHCDALRPLRCDTEVVGDEQHAESIVSGEVAEQIEYALLHCHVECCGGLVGDDERWFCCDGRGDEHALAHAAGELVGVAVVDLLDAAQTDPFEEFEHAPFPRGSIETSVHSKRLGSLLADGEQRVQSQQGVLRHVADGAPPETFVLLRWKVDEIGTVEDDRALGDARVRRECAGDGAGDGALARSGLAHKSEHFSAPQREADVGDHRDRRACARPVLERKARELQDVRWSLCVRIMRQRWSSPGSWNVRFDRPPAPTRR
nr:hypothetical protein [Leucobacter chromiiresistens]